MVLNTLSKWNLNQSPVSKAGPHRLLWLTRRLWLAWGGPSQQRSQCRVTHHFACEVRGPESKMTNVKDKEDHLHSSATVWISTTLISAELAFLLGFQSPPTSLPQSMHSQLPCTQNLWGLTVPPLFRHTCHIFPKCAWMLNIILSRVQGERTLNPC